MNSKTLLIAPPGARRKREAVFERIVALCPGADFSSVLYLGPDESFLAAVRRLFFSYLRKRGKAASYVPFQTFTLRQIASHLYETYGEREVLTDEMRTLIILGLLEDHNLGYARLLSGLQNKIRHYLPDRDLSALTHELEHMIFEEKARERAKSALGILQAYEEKLERRKLADPDGILHDVIPVIGERFSPEVLIVDGFFDPSPLETGFMEALADSSGRVVILAEEETPLSNIAPKVGSFAVVNLKPVFKRSGSGYYEYPSVEEEVEGIAKGIKKLLLDDVRPGEIAVSFPVLSKYLPIVQRVFLKYGIPMSIGKHELSFTKPLVAVKDLIVCLEEDYPRIDFLSVLTSPVFTKIPGIVKEEALSFAYRAGVIRGKESWLSIEKTLESGSSGIQQDNLRQIAEFQNGIRQVIEIIEDVNLAGNVASYVDAFESALNSLGYFDALEGDSTGTGTSIAEKVYGQFAALRRFAQLNEPSDPGSPDPGVSLEYLLEDISESGQRHGGVRVVPFDQAVSLETKELFFGGMVEGDFPFRPGIDPILPERVKKELGLPDLEYYLQRQRKYFTRLLHVSENGPQFSCPAADGDKIFLASPILDWEQKRAPVKWGIFTDEEVHVRDGIISRGDSLTNIAWDGELRLRRRPLERIRKKFSGYLNVTDIDFYRKCPKRFYIERVLHLEIEEPPRFEVEARLWGSLAHKVMELLYRDGDIPIAEIEIRLSASLRSSLEHFPISDFWGKVAGKIFQKLLPKIKEQEREIRAGGYAPVMVERKVSAGTGGLKLKGKIDRVDAKTHDAGSRLHGSQQKEDIRPVRLLDYKTGTPDRESLQMPLYALMWQELFSQPVEKVGIYSLRDGRVEWYPRKISMDEYILKARDTAEELVMRMRNGDFPPEPSGPAECRYCGHSPMCKGSE